VEGHYFSTSQSAPSSPFEIRAKARGRELCLRSDRGVFSAERLDRGTRLLLESMELAEGARVLDLGCGYGALGVFAGLDGAGQVIMVDVNPRAVGLAWLNAQRHGLADSTLAVVADGTGALARQWADLCLLNPPIRAGREVVASLIHGAAQCLRPEGRLALVARTSQGVKSLARVMADVLDEVGTVAKGGGFRVVEGTARVSEGPEDRRGNPCANERPDAGPHMGERPFGTPGIGR
jgi:16S rRNA (guanine1207-N2)-methyltransferase